MAPQAKTVNQLVYELLLDGKPRTVWEIQQDLNGLGVSYKALDLALQIMRSSGRVVYANEAGFELTLPPQRTNVRSVDDR